MLIIESLMFAWPLAYLKILNFNNQDDFFITFKFIATTEKLTITDILTQKKKKRRTF